MPENITASQLLGALVGVLFLQGLVGFFFWYLRKLDVKKNGNAGLEGRIIRMETEMETLKKEGERMRKWRHNVVEPRFRWYDAEIVRLGGKAPITSPGLMGSESE